MAPSHREALVKIEKWLCEMRKDAYDHVMNVRRTLDGPTIFLLEYPGLMEKAIVRKLGDKK